MSAPALQLGFVFPARRQSIDERFAAFDQANPRVYRLLEQHAMQLVAMGARRIGVKALWEQIRGTITTSEFRPSLNNDFTACYARKLIDHHPILAEVIETRARRSPSFPVLSRQV